MTKYNRNKLVPRYQAKIRITPKKQVGIRFYQKNKSNSWYTLQHWKLLAKLPVASTLVSTIFVDGRRAAKGKSGPEGKYPIRSFSKG